LFAIVLGDADRFEALWVLVQAKSVRECWKVITVVWYAVAIGCSSLFSSGFNDGANVVPIINLSAEIFCW
jgi:hypothetical protein